MQYDPIKKSLGRVFNRTPALRIFFYRLLDLLLLRSWHIRREIRKLGTVGFSPEMIADAGSGFGQYVYYLSKKFPEAKIRGLDIKQEQVDDCNTFFGKLNEGHRISFHCTDLTLISDRESYDLILCVDVMEHIEEDRVVLQNYYNALRPGGVLLISTPSDQGGSDVHHEHDSSFIDEHVRDGYGQEEMEEKLQSAGFRENHIRFSYGKPGKLSWKLSMKYPILMVNASKFFLILLPLYYLLVYPVCFILNMSDVRGNHRTGTGLIVMSRK